MHFWSFHSSDIVCWMNPKLTYSFLLVHILVLDSLFYSSPMSLCGLKVWLVHSMLYHVVSATILFHFRNYVSSAFSIKDSQLIRLIFLKYSVSYYIHGGLRWSTKYNCTKSNKWIMCLTIKDSFNHLTARILAYVRTSTSFDRASRTFVSVNIGRRWTITNANCSVLLYT